MSAIQRNTVHDNRSHPMPRILLLCAAAIVLSACTSLISAPPTHILTCTECATDAATVFASTADGAARKCTVPWEARVRVIKVDADMAEIVGPGCSGWVALRILTPVAAGD
jgi:hypothetical protein